MEKVVKCLLLKNDLILVSEIIEIGSDIGEPDCKLINPYKLIKQSETHILEPWIDYSSQNEFMIHSDSILTLVDPIEDILAKYVELTA